MEKINIDILQDKNIIDKKIFLDNMLKSNPDWLEFIYVSDFSNTIVLRDIISLISDIKGIQEPWKARFILIADELNNNAVEYWSNSWEYNIMRVFFNKNSEDKMAVTIEVEDTWNSANHKTSEHMEKLRDEKLKKGFFNYYEIRWRWLFLMVTKLVDKLYFVDSQNW